MRPVNAFQYHLDQLQELLVKASADKDPGMWLLKNNGRTPVFMVEALCKIYKDLDEKTFTKLKARFKTLEDAIGRLDYYTGFEEQYKEDAAMSAFIKKRISETSKQLNTILTGERWIIKDYKRIRKAFEKLEKIKWPEEKENILLIDRFYKKSIGEIEEFYHSTGEKFNDIEQQIHELRRKLRWLSIYPHAVRGTIQLHGNIDYPELQSYVTEDVIHSPFNTFPPEANCIFVFLLNKTPFLALSWMISSLGKLKDNGLRYILEQESGKTNNPDATQLKMILENASAVTKDFFDKKVLQQLVYNM